MPSSIRSLVLPLILSAASLSACTTPVDDGPGGGAGAGGTPAAGGADGTAGKGGKGGGGGKGGKGGSPKGGSGGETPGMGGAGGEPPGTGGNGPVGGAGGSETDASNTPVPDAASLPDADTTSMGRPPKPSAGCGKANPATGGRTIQTGGKTANYTVTLPAGYDPNKPWPLGFAYHGYGLNEKTCAAGSECPGFKDLKAITVYQKSIGAGWEYPIPLLEPNIKFFEDVVALMKAEYCVDENRIFVAGVSSGGQFVEHLSCRYGDWLWAVSPIAAYVDKGVDMNCKGAPPQVIIHGITDNLEKNGHAVRDLFAKRNGCPTVPAGMAKAEADMKAARAATRAEYACVTYEGCAKNPVEWCVFSQVTYNGLTHGWPKVGGKLISEFLGTLK